MRKEPNARERLPIGVYPILLIPVFIIIAVTILGWGKGWWRLPRDIPPPDTSDLVLDRLSIPDEENALTYLDSEKLPLVGKGEFQKVAATNQARLVELLDENQPVFAQLERGFACQYLEPPLVDMEDTVPFLSNWLSVGRLLGLKAAHERRTGRHDEAMETCGMLFRFSSITRKRPTTTVQLLISDAVLQIGLAQAVGFTREPAVTDEHLAAFAGPLVNLPPDSECAVRVLKAQYGSSARFVEGIANGDNSDLSPWPDQLPFGRKFKAPPEYLVQPNRTKKALADSTRVRIRNVGRCYADLDFTDDPYAKREPVSAKGALKPNGIGDFLGRMCAWRPDSLATHLLHVETDVSATRLIIACRRYELAKQSLPDSLDDLVPEYLPEVPRDPFDGKPFRYKKADAIVYAVGKDLVDNDGSCKLTEERVRRSHRWRAEDAVFGIREEVAWEDPATNSPPPSSP